MQEESRTIGYICPDCGKAVIANKSKFALTAGRSSVSCECGKSMLELETDGQKYHIYVPCGICGKTHTAECTTEALFSGKGIGLACPTEGQLCCYIGEEAQVVKAVRNLEVLAAKTKESQKEESQELFLDSIIMQEVLSELKDIAARPNGFSCSCGCKDIKMTIRHAAVDLECSSCGSKLRIPAATDEDLDNLCCQMKLQIRGKNS